MYKTALNWLLIMFIYCEYRKMLARGLVALHVSGGCTYHCLDDSWSIEEWNIASRNIILILFL